MTTPGSGPVRVGRRAVLGVVLAAVLLGCGGADPADRRAELLAAVPAAALDRGVHLWEGGLDDGFGSVVPPRALAALGLAPEDVAAVAESGGAPLTVLLADVRAAAVAEAASSAGYDVAEVGRWAVLRRSADRADALQAAVPAAAVRDGLVVVGPPDEVAAIVDGTATAAGAGWALALSADTEEPALGLAPPLEMLAAAAEAEGVDAGALLDRAGARGDLPAWEGWGVALDDDGAGALVLALPPGQADADAAAALALRAATGPLVDRGRRAVDVLEGGAPRFDAVTGVVRLPVTWRADPRGLRVDVERGAFTFLVPR